MAYIQKSFLKTGALSNKNENNIVEDISYLISNKGQDITLTDGTLDPAVQSALYELPGLITSSDGTVYKRYKLEGVIKMDGTGTFTNFAGVISGDQGLLLYSDSTTINARNVNTFDNVSTKMYNSSVVKNSATSNIANLTFSFVIMDNSIASNEDYFITFIFNAPTTVQGVCFINLEFLAEAANVITYSN
jgi:hypothetical protein